MKRLPSLYSIPLKWDVSFVDKILEYETAKRRISYFYGCLDLEGFTHGRKQKGDHPGLKEAKKIVDHIHHRDRKFKYLLNGLEPSYGTVDDEERKKQIKIIHDQLQPDAVVCSTEKTLTLVRELYPDWEIHLSTISRVKSLEELQPYLAYHPKIVVAQHDLPKEPVALIQIVRFCKQQDIALEIMVTDGCIYQCPWMKNHYQTLSDGLDDRTFHQRCAEERRKHPAQWLASASFIRPADISFYEDLGISNFKLTGRGQRRDYLVRVAQAYLQGVFEGNVAELMDVENSSEKSTLPVIDEQAFDGLIQELFQDKSKRWIPLVNQYFLRAVKEGTVKPTDA
ncbi:hypothetical protein H1S01_07220 [Heliobacterium chlorum]|uniref:Uncharacterized protein n=1 Tax=Heliobacterium chlorum TaxID=2698 RepID=A0ABR7T2U3_HELCL|nr:U32 family peptidase [Heliobacterium chlorum]MBC9784300.1 hypothetical protein [Heliobacterium chlorum]